MAYTKMQKGIPDFSLGFQTINALNNSIEQIRVDYAVKHGILSAALGGTINHNPTLSAPWLSKGRHNDQNIPRGVIRVGVQSITPVPGGPAILYVSLGPESKGVANVQRLSEGSFVVTSPFMSTNSYADVGCECSGATPVRRGYARNQMVAVSSAIQQGYLVSLQELGAGVWSPADFSFSLHFKDVT